MKYYQASGCGNDFLALVEPTEEPTEQEIAAWCRRGVSLGADGLFILRRAGQHVAMDYFNADGRRAELCLNGTRCAARLAFELGWAEQETIVATGAGPIRAREAAGGEIEIDIAAPAQTPEQAPRPLELKALGEVWRGFFLAVGVPHFVLFWPEPLALAPVERAGAALRRHEAFGAAGSNVDFVRFPAPDRMEIRTFERGVEAETLACGTGVLASTATALAQGRARLPLSALTSGGFELRVRARDERLWALAGDARILSHGTLRPAAARSPAPARFSP